MINPLCTTLTKSDLSELAIPKTFEIVKKGGLYLVDISGQVADGIQDKIDSATSSLNKLAPSCARSLISNFPAPDNFDDLAVKSVTFITQGTSALVKLAATTGVQAVLFGAPAYAQALRSVVAVWGVTGGLKEGDDSQQFLARCMAKLDPDPNSRDTLLRYVSYRKQLTAESLSSNSPVNLQSNIRPASHLAARSVFSNPAVLDEIDSVLDQSSSFAKNNPDRTKQIAHEIANKLIQEVEQFYQNNLAPDSSTVATSWSKLDSSRGRESELARHQRSIASRLERIFKGDLNPEQTATQINKISALLNSAFGTYRATLRGGTGTLLGVAWMSGALLSWAAVTWGYITGGVGRAVRYSVKEFNKFVASGVTMVHEWIKSYTDELKDGIKEAIEERMTSHPALAKKEATSTKASPEPIANKVSHDTAPIIVGLYTDLKLPPADKLTKTQQQGLMQVETYPVLGASRLHASESQLSISA
jgi:hypothetical protein